jgi:hypothetical protein
MSAKPKNRKFMNSPNLDAQGNPNATGYRGIGERPDSIRKQEFRQGMRRGGIFGGMRAVVDADERERERNPNMAKNRKKSLLGSKNVMAAISATRFM